MGSYFVKVDSPGFQLPQVVLDNLPDWATVADVSYTHTQATASAVWEIVHPLPFVPNVTITDSAGTAVLTEITYPAPNIVRSTSAGAFSGIARLS